MGSGEPSIFLRPKLKNTSHCGDLTSIPCILVEWAAKDSSNSRGEFQFPPSFSMNYQSCLRIMAAGTYRVPQYIFTVFLWCAMMRYRQNRESQLLGCSHTSTSEDRGKAKM
ncbi:uncharacterized protein LOC111908223 isoform X3 [Lactuca sativa]|uniref:uncharacterized protein LOC111908223 isoform X3 n=1 Tax=Lactuca sativa TaxID=4236 RepID=UPI001C68BB67|nr:uncharacterized protein LOC111908223 isoform X3 [Lactuca sativa]